MSVTASVLAIAGALTLGAMSPGPSFVLVARVAVAFSRKDALAAALGMGIGGLILAVAAIAGLQAILTAVPVLYVLMKIAGGAYLLYLGWRIWLGAKQPLTVATSGSAEGTQSLRRSFLIALSTQLSNPKTAVVYGSIFAALLPREVSWQLSLLLCAVVLVIETGWYAVVAVALSSTRSRRAYLSYKAVIDRIAGSVMALLGIRLISSGTSA